MEGQGVAGKFYQIINGINIFVSIIYDLYSSPNFEIISFSSIKAVNEIAVILTEPMKTWITPGSLNIIPVPKSNKEQ